MKSTEIIKPTVLSAPLAYEGSKNIIPVQATGTNAASIAEGFPEQTSIPKKDGGLPPQREDFNGMFYLSTDQRVFIQNGGVITFSQDVSDAIGGYPEGAILNYVSGNSYIKVRSLIDDNTYNFNENSSYIDNEHWEKVYFGADTALSNLTATGEDKLNTSKMYETGSVSTDEQGYKQLAEMSHSTFDLSKFTVVGSPVITDDGIASGFKNGVNYLKTPIKTTDFLNKSWEIVCCFKPFTVISAFTLWKFTAPDSVAGVDPWGSLVFNPNNKNLVFWYRTGDESENSNQLYQSIPLTNYMDNMVYCSYAYNHSTGVYTFKTYLKDGTVIATRTYTATTSNTQLYYVNTESTYIITIGTSYTGTADVGGLIDLKSFSIAVDGVPVFSGNKTGIDTVKPDNYEVVGSPVITDDGIASSGTGSNYIEYTLPTSITTQDFEIIAKFKHNELSNTIDYVLYGGNNSNQTHLNWRLENNGFRMTLQDADSNNVMPYFNLFNPQTKWFYVRLKREGAVFTNYYSYDGISWTLGQTIEQADVTLAIDFIRILRNSNENASSDLNSFKIYVDGNLVYQPCLKIPYTLSKTGSKVVDAVYRDRVQDVYTQEGYASYYTIDEEHKTLTLPMGEIYGMIGTERATVNTKVDAAEAAHAAMPSAKSIALSTGANGTNYTAPADGYFQVGGTNASKNGTSFVGLHNTSTGISSTLRVDNINGGIDTYIPARKNDVIRLNYTNFNVTGLRFVYAEGAQDD